MPIDGVLAGETPRPQGTLRDWFEIARPFSLTASAVPALVGTAAGWWGGHLNVAAFAAVLVGSVLLQAGTNMVNEVFDVARGVDTPETPRASRVLVEGRLSPQAAHRGGILSLLAAVAVGAWLSWGLGLGAVPFVLGVLGAIAGYGYTAPPLEYKYHALGTPLVFVLMGPVMVLGADFVQAGHFTAAGLIAALPVGCLVAAILHANELRDAEADLAAGTRTLPALIGRRHAASLYNALLAGGYVAILLGVTANALPWPAGIALFTLPLAARAAGRVRRAAAAGMQPQANLERLDQQTAMIHLSTGVLLALGLALAAAGL